MKKTLVITTNLTNPESASDISNSLYGILKRFPCYQSISKIEETFNLLENFSFHEVTEGKNRQEILRLDGTEATLVADISAEMLKSSIDIHTSILQKIIDLS